MNCSNCGAEIRENEVNCPYCGVINPRAAEKKHMTQLEGIRRQTEMLEDVAGHEARSGRQKAGRRAVVIFCIVAAVIGGLFLAVRALDRALMGDDDYVRAEAAFKEKYFPRLDELYEAGDDDATADYMESLYGEEGSSVLPVWDHYKYMTYYMDYITVASVMELPPGEEPDVSMYEHVLYAGIELIYQTEDNSQHPMTAEEKEKVAGYKAEARQILEECLSLDKDTLEEAYQAGMAEAGFLSGSRLHEWVERRNGEKG